MENEQLTVLIVDDDSFFRQLIVRLLTPLNYRVIEARTVSDAIAALNQGPNLAIIDYRMPGVDGATFIKSLREQGYKLPIVFCSGSGIDQKTFASMRNVYQVDLIIKKPIQPDNFVQLIGELLPIKTSAVEFAQDQEIIEEKVSGHNLEQERADDQENYQYSCEEEIDVAPLPANFESAASMEADEAIAELANMYLMDLPETFDQLRLEMIMAAAQKDCGLLKIASNRAHQVRGTAGSLGFARLSELGKELELQINALIEDQLDDDNDKWNDINLLIDEAANCTQMMINPEKIEERGESVDAVGPSAGDLSAKLEKSVEEEEEEEEEEDDKDKEVKQKGVIFADQSCLPLPASTHVAARLTPPRLLVVEINLDTTRQITSIFEGEGMIVRSVLGAMEAFAVMDDFQPDVVLLQFAMPGVSGIEMCRMIRCNSRWQNLPVIMLTESLSAATRYSLFEAGASDFALTPVVAAELKVRVKSHLQLSMEYAKAV